jgi:hypothetical protein
MKTELESVEARNTTDGALVDIAKASRDTKGSQMGGWDGGYGWII